MSDRRAELTLEDLVRWQDHGAGWRAVELDDGHVIVELRTCYGEPVDRQAGTAPELIAFVREHPHHP